MSSGNGRNSTQVSQGALRPPESVAVATTWKTPGVADVYRAIPFVSRGWSTPPTVRERRGVPDSSNPKTWKVMDSPTMAGVESTERPTDGGALSPGFRMWRTPVTRDVRPLVFVAVTRTGNSP